MPRPGQERSKPRVLIAGTRQAVDVLSKVLGNDFELLSATSIAAALERLEEGVELVLCNVRFDDSRMFEFIHALRTPAADWLSYRIVEIFYIEHGA